jgi:aryl-alcohol dehydrogenase-like predicted oxidoreductase
MDPRRPPAAAAGVITLLDGRTVHRMGFGAMRLTGPGIWGEPADPDECRQVLRRAIELGVNFIDTADSYGPEVSERLIGETLHPYPEDLVIATKGGQRRPGPGRWEPDGRPEHLRSACEGSLRRLRVETIDLYQLHRPDPRVPFEESVGALVRLRDEGKVHMIGLSNVTLGQLAAARGMTDVASVQNRYNVGDRQSEAVLNRCSELGIAFLPWAPLSGGQLDAESPRVRDLARRKGVGPAQLALAWLLKSSPVMLTRLPTCPRQLSSSRLSSVWTWLTLTTESSGRPAVPAFSNRLPGRRASRTLLVRPATTTVLIFESLNLSAEITRLGRRPAGVEPTIGPKSVHQTSPRRIKAMVRPQPPTPHAPGAQRYDEQPPYSKPPRSRSRLLPPESCPTLPRLWLH